MLATPDRLALALLLVLVAALVPSSSGQRVFGPPRFGEKRMIVKILNSNGQDVAERLSTTGNTCEMLTEYYNLMCLKLSTPHIEHLQGNPDIEWVKDDDIVVGPAAGDDEDLRGNQENDHKVDENEDDRDLQQSTGYPPINTQYNLVDQAPEGQEGAVPTKVCIIDSGYGLGHPDLPTLEMGYLDGTQVTENINCHRFMGIWNVCVSPNPLGDVEEAWQQDRASHGTPVASIIAAIDNDVGNLGVNPTGNNFRLFIARALDDQISSTASDVLNAMLLCRQARSVDEEENMVINLSLQYNSEPSIDEFAQVFDDLYNDDNIMIVASAGNCDSNCNIDAYPASYPTVVSVAAANGGYRIDATSIKNDQVEIAAPGVDIRVASTLRQGFTTETVTGTSFAAPFVSGVIAKVWSYFPICNVKQMRYAMRNSADSRLTSCNIEQGVGHIRTLDMFNFIQEHINISSEGTCDALPEYVGEGGCSVLPQGVSDATLCQSDAQCVVENFESARPTAGSMEVCAVECEMTASSVYYQYDGVDCYCFNECLDVEFSQDTNLYATSLGDCGELPACC